MSAQLRAVKSYNMCVPSQPFLRSIKRGRSISRSPPPRHLRSRSPSRGRAARSPYRGPFRRPFVRASRSPSLILSPSPPYSRSLSRSYSRSRSPLASRRFATRPLGKLTPYYCCCLAHLVRSLDTKPGSEDKSYIANARWVSKFHLQWVQGHWYEQVFLFS